MNKYHLLIVLGLFLAWSCNSDETNNQQKDNEIVTSDEDLSLKKETKEPEKTVQQEPKINQKFKAFLSKFSKASLPYKENPSGTEEYPKIPIKEQVEYLSKAEKLSEANLKDMSDYTDFYYISNPINTKKFHAIVYGRFEMGSVYYFLCTYDNDGKLISHIDFAAYEMIAAGPQAGQEYNTKGFIDENREITVKNDDETRKYKIQEDGKIIRL